MLTYKFFIIFIIVICYCNTNCAQVIYNIGSLNATSNSTSCPSLPDHLVLTDGDHGEGGSYEYFPVHSNMNCFSFEVRAKELATVVLSRSKSTLPDAIEIVLGHDGDTVLRQRPNYRNHLVVIPSPSIINRFDLRGFWIGWSNYVIEVGLLTRTRPFLIYQFPKKIEIKYAGILTWMTPGTWILHGEPKCPPQ